MSNIADAMKHAAAPLEGSESRTTKMLSKACEEVGNALEQFSRDRELQRLQALEAATEKPKPSGSAPQRIPTKIDMKPPAIKPPGGR